MAGYVLFICHGFFLPKVYMQTTKKNQLLNIIWFNPLDAFNLTDIKNSKTT